MGCNLRSVQYMDRVISDERCRPGVCEHREFVSPTRSSHFTAYVTVDNAATVINGSSFDEVVEKLVSANRKSGGILVVHHIKREDAVYLPNIQEEVRCRAAELLRPTHPRRDDATGDDGTD